MPYMYVMHWPLLRILFATAATFGSYIYCALCRWPDSAIASSVMHHKIWNLEFAICKSGKKHGVFLVKEGILVVLCKNAEFHVDPTHTAGGVVKQTKWLYKNI